MNKAAFEKWWAENRHMGGEPGATLVTSTPSKEKIWQYFHREFPREAAEMQIANQTSLTTAQISLVLRIFERLWNGDQEGVCTMGCADTVCPTCRGSGEKCTLLSDPHNSHSNCDMQPCPDCKEQFTFLRQDGLKYPNERKGQERRVNSKHTKRRMKTWGYIDAILVDKSYSVADCGDENYQVVDKIIQVIAADTGEPLTSLDDIPLYMPNNRKKDRRRSQ